MNFWVLVFLFQIKFGHQYAGCSHKLDRNSEGKTLFLSVDFLIMINKLQACSLQ